MTVKSLAANFRRAVLRGNEILQDGVSVKGLVLEDLIQNAQALFNEGPLPPLPPPVPTLHVAQTVPMSTYSSLLTPESSQSTEVHAIDSTSRHPFTSNQSPSSPSLSDSHVGTPGRRLAPTDPLAKPPAGASVVTDPSGGMETTTQEQAILKARGTKAVKTFRNSTPGPSKLIPTSGADWWLQPPSHQGVTQSLPESIVEGGQGASASKASWSGDKSEGGRFSGQASRARSREGDDERDNGAKRLKISL
ncbi:hypothetical protein EDB85DRAFT_1274353 [Lactarius pseudohatsudake]|nr:hypothetical protein EDB85DRAFT_1274353 [Lactarius pseudohatsudake]